MTEFNYSFRKCSKCKSTKLQRSFGINSKGELYKTCEVCRIQNRVNTTKYLLIINNINEVKTS